MRFGGVIYWCYIIHKGARPPVKRYGVMGPITLLKRFFVMVYFSQKIFMALWRPLTPHPHPISNTFISKTRLQMPSNILRLRNEKIFFILQGQGCERIVQDVGLRFLKNVCNPQFFSKKYIHKHHVFIHPPTKKKKKEKNHSNFILLPISLPPPPS